MGSDPDKDRVDKFFADLYAKVKEKLASGEKHREKLREIDKETRESKTPDGKPFVEFLASAAEKFNGLFVEGSHKIFDVDDAEILDGLYSSIGPRIQILQFHKFGETLLRLGTFYFLQTMLSVKMNNADMEDTRTLTISDRGYLLRLFTDLVDAEWKIIIETTGDKIDEIEDDRRNTPSDN